MDPSLPPPPACQPAACQMDFLLVIRAVQSVFIVVSCRRTCAYQRCYHYHLIEIQLLILLIKVREAVLSLLFCGYLYLT